MIRERYPLHKIIYDAALAGWYALVEVRRRGSHAGPRAPLSRAGAVALVLAVPLVLGPALGGVLVLALDLTNDGAGRAGGQPTRRTVPLTKVVETSTGARRPVPNPTSAYDGQGPSVEPDRRPIGQNPGCWIGTPGWPHDC